MTVLMQGLETMDQKTFGKFRDLVYEKSGIALSDNKISLVQSRVSKRLRELSLDSFEKYYEYVRNDKTGDELSNLIDVISTNVTNFFRENDHLIMLGEFVEKRISAGQTRFRFWSAACSSGEEPYSMAISTNESIKGRSIDWRILATDISTVILEKARNATYAGKQLNTVPALLRDKYFSKSGYGDSGQYEVRKELKNVVSYARINLSAPPFPMKGPFDIIFCRNVMIYFDMKVKERLLMEFHRLLADDGCLMLGMSESTTGLKVPFKSIAPSVYVKS